MRYYTYLSFVMAAVATMTTFKVTGRSGPVAFIMIDNAVSGVTITAYMIFAIFSCAYSYRMTTRPGMSSEIRKDFIMRHILYVLVYIIVWLPYLGLTFYTIYACQMYQAMGYEMISPTINDQFTSEIKKWWDYNNGASAFTGSIMACIRISEPAMWAVFCSIMLCQKKDKSQAGDQAKPT